MTKQTRESRIAFDAVEGISDLPSWVWDAVEEVVAETGAQIIERDSERLNRRDSKPYRIEQYSQRRGGFFSLFSRERIRFFFGASVTHRNASRITPPQCGA